MSGFLAACAILLSSLPAPSSSTAGEARAEAPTLAKKQAAVSWIEAHRHELIALSDRVWRYAEVALRETRSSAALADYAERNGFEVERGVAGLPTAFVASYGEGRPIIGVLGEYDALPGLSQKTVPAKRPLTPGAPGHGCGHNLFGVGSLGAAVAIKERIAAGDLHGTVRFYGTPAEEAVGGKLYMARDGLFDDLDMAFAWHPGTEIQIDTDSSLAMVDLHVDFLGRAAHAAYDPWNGRSALDGLELFTHALNLLREHVRPTVRIHYTILDGGDVPNVVPDRARLWCWVRDEKRARVDELLERIRGIARGAALAAGVESRVRVQSGAYELLVNLAGARAMHANLMWLGPLRFTEEEQQFARAIQEATGVEPEGLAGEIEPLDEHPGPTDRGSTDLADVSWIVPTVDLTVTTAPAGAPWHAWPVVATGGMSIGHKGMLYAAGALAATMVDVYERPALLRAIRAEFDERTRGHAYRGYIPDGPPPIPYGD
ncbi:MAG: amidohydrolase [Acidobacteriota bacterium]